jgi:MinD superfamily P-loop ATPase
MSGERNEIKQLAIVSGKGGTRKTTIAAAFSSLAKNKGMVDCDVDAADLHLLLQPRILKHEKYFKTPGRITLRSRRSGYRNAGDGRTRNTDEDRIAL